MRFSAGPLSVEVQFAVRDVPLVEYGEEEVGARDRSCYIGVAAGQYLQINMNFSGPWEKARCDIVIDGVLCRIVGVAGAAGGDRMWKFVDQVWLPEHDQMQYARMTVETVTPSREPSPRAVLEKEDIQEHLTRSLTQSISIVVYSNAVGSHEVTLPCILNQDCHPDASLLTSPTYIARPSDPGRTHRIRLLSIGGPPKPIRSRHEHGSRWGYEPFASFNFDYRDSELLKQLDLPVSTEKPFNMPGRRKRTHHAFLEGFDHAQYSRQSSDDVKSGIGASSAGSGYYKRQVEWGHDGYGPGSHYRPCESQSRRSVESEDTLGSMSTGANTIPVSSHRTSHVACSSSVRDEQMRPASQSRFSNIMSAVPTTSGAHSWMDLRDPHSHLTPSLSRHGDPRQHKQSDPILETPRSPPPQSPEIQPTVFRETPVFREMSQEMYGERISVVAIPAKFIAMNLSNRKIMPLAMLRIKEEEDSKERDRLKQTSARYH